MLRWRLLLGILIVGSLVGLCWADHVISPPGVILFPLLLGLVWLGTKEVLFLVEAGGMKPLRWVVYAGNLLIVTSSWCACIYCNSYFEDQPFRSWHWSATASVWTLLALVVGILLAFVAEMRRFKEPGGVTVNLAAAIFSMTYIGFLLSFLVQLRMAWDVMAVCSLIIVVKMADTGAYTVGRLVGRNKMAPGLSPGKTIEGAIGGLVFACLGSWFTFTVLVPDGASPIGIIVFGLSVGVMGMTGDLAESLIKRDVQQKDSSTWMPGFGGVLDILDSVLLAAPVAFACWAFRLVGGVH